MNVLDSKKLTTYNTLVEFVPAIYYTDSTSIPTLPTTKKVLSKDGNCEININALNYIYIFIPTSLLVIFSLSSDKEILLPITITVLKACVVIPVELVTI